MDQRDDLDQRPEPGAGIAWGGIITLLGVVLIVVFAAQNAGSTTIDFLWLSGDFPLSVVILVTAVASVLFTLTAGALFRRRRRKRRAERIELEELRKGE